MDINIAVAQIAPKKGDLTANLEHVGSIFYQITRAEQEVDIVVLPETALSGYFLEGGVIDAALPAEELMRLLDGVYRAHAFDAAKPVDVVIGFIERFHDQQFNSAMYVTVGGAEPTIQHVHRKFFLPTYGVFDEQRFITAGRTVRAFESRFGTNGMLLCEDAWHSLTSTILALQGATLIFIPLASPGRGFADHDSSNISRWSSIAKYMAQEHGVYVVTASLVGFEGGKGFVGGSVVVNPFGNVLAEGLIGQECIIYATMDTDDVRVARLTAPLLSDLTSQIAALTQELACASAGPASDSD